MHACTYVCDTMFFCLFVPAVCDTVQNTCSSDAQCSVSNSGGVVCTCNTNYQGNGQTCTRRCFLSLEMYDAGAWICNRNTNRTTKLTWVAGIACWSEHQAHDLKVVSSNPGRSSRRVFLSRVNCLCWLLLSVHSTPMLPQWHVRDPGHSVKSAGGR